MTCMPVRSRREDRRSPGTRSRARPARAAGSAAAGGSAGWRRRPGWAGDPAGWAGNPAAASTAAASSSSSSGRTALRSSSRRPSSTRPTTAGNAPDRTGAPARSAAVRVAGRLTAALGSGTPGAPPPPTAASLGTARASSPAPASRAATRPARAASDAGLAASAAASGTGGPDRLASRAAIVVLPTRRARASGCRASRCTSSARPRMRPACGPPSSLSPLAVTSAAPASSQDAASGSAGSSGWRRSRPEPMSPTTGTPSPARSATPGCAVKPSIRKFDGCTLRMKPVSGPQARA